MPTPLGRFFRTWCQPTPTPGAEPKHQRRGDVLPIPPWLVSKELPGITDANFHWVWLLVVILDFNYCAGWGCAGWGKPIAVPMEPVLTANQIKAITSLASMVTANVISADPFGTLGEARELLASKRFDYAGAPIEYMEDLVAEKVAPAWRPSEAGVQPIERYFSAETADIFKYPDELLLPKDKMQERAPRSRVRASDQEWFKFCKLGHDRGMMKVVSDDLIPRDRMGHLITSGAGAVKKEKIINGGRVMCQRFISILCPLNAVTIPMKGAQDTLPFIGTMTSIQLEEEQIAYMESEDLQSAFNLFAAPAQWLPYFAYKMVDSAAFGLEPGTLVRPAVVQEAVRTLVFERAGVPRSLSVEKGKPLPASGSKAIVYLDNFDEVHVVSRLAEDFTKEGTVMSEYHRKFVEVCDSDGLPRNAGKQLIHAYAGGLQGGQLYGLRGVLKAAPDKLQNFMKISLALFAGKKWTEYHLRHWAGKAAFMAAFRSFLFSNLFEVFPLIEQSRRGDVAPTKEVTDEILCVCALSAVALAANLRAALSDEVSCTDASPWGGATAVAKKFKCFYLQIPDSQPDDGRCAWCEQEHEPGQTTYPCSRKCGLRACSPMCTFSHAEGNCSRRDLDASTFGERFAGANFPLTQAVALEGVAIQPPLDIKIPSYPWDFFTEAGKRKLEQMESDNSLAASHWAPECKTYTAARGRPIRLASGRTMLASGTTVKRKALGVAKPLT